MSGYPNPPPGHGYGYSAPPTANPYGGPPTANPYAGPPISNSYSAPPPAQHYSANPYGGPPPSHGQSSPYDQYAAPHSTSSGHGKPPQDYSHSCGGVYQPSSTPPYGSPFASLVPSVFPPGTDPNVIACFQLADQDGSGMIDDKEMQRALSSYNQSFSLRTVHLLMHHFTSANAKKIATLIGSASGCAVLSNFERQWFLSRRWKESPVWHQFTRFGRLASTGALSYRFCCSGCHIPTQGIYGSILQSAELEGHF
ncbi:probable calcium-binding protein CML50 isoform X3 [Neltuma alba]|uniref:probable calcium-binding protein CML50 isoform X3 n=1 Tax=Neltuma alba TaxID=207710 RepID=UPI0010A35135|nr:probable calcium-binding protein CML50 isoform X3 [Prosopis alba]